MVVQEIQAWLFPHLASDGQPNGLPGIGLFVGLIALPLECCSRFVMLCLLQCSSVL